MNASKKILWQHRIINKIDKKAPPLIATIVANTFIAGCTSMTLAILAMFNTKLMVAQPTLILVGTTLTLSSIALLVGAKLQRMHYKLDQ